MKKAITFLAIMISVLLKAQSWESWNPTLTGHSVTPTLVGARNTTGDSTTTAYCAFSVTSGSSNYTNFTICLPRNAATSFTQKDVCITTNAGINGFGRIVTRSGSNVADLCPSATSGINGWTASGVKSVSFSITYESIPLYHHLYFDGNSLMRRGGGVVNQNGVAFGVNDSLLSDGRYFTIQNYAIGGSTTTQLLSEWGTKIKPYIDTLDIVVLWEITNDVAAGLTATQAYNNVVSWCDSVRAAGAKAVVFTGIPRNDNAAYWPKIDSVNTMLRTDTAKYDLLIDLNTDSRFDAAADANNTIYYLSDRIHLTSAGELIVIQKALAGLRPKIITWY